MKSKIFFSVAAICFLLTFNACQPDRDNDDLNIAEINGEISALPADPIAPADKSRQGRTSFQYRRDYIP